MSGLELVLPDGSVLSVADGTGGMEAARAVSEALAKRALAVSVDGVLSDLRLPLPGGGAFRVVTDRDPQALDVLRHSAAHVMADAVTRLFGGSVGLGIGPAIEDGFYYDFDLPESLSVDDLPRIEELMAGIAKADLPFEVETVSKAEARALMEKLGQEYKLELLDDIEEERVTLFRHGDFVDLCRGPHLPSTGGVRHFKLLSVAGAYWRGDERRKMLTRVYGTAFFKKKALEEHLSRLEEAKRRDHRTLGRTLDLYSVHSEVGAGLIHWHPKGAVVRRAVEDFWVREHVRRGYRIVYTPHIASAKVYQISGHLENYAENMYSPMEIEGSPYYLKPMNCVGHIMIYKSRQRSYRELPVRYAELGTVYRYERSGVLHGLLRVRGFTQDDAHIFCTPEQVVDEVMGVFKLADFMLKSFGYDYKVYLATRPEKYIGSERRWEEATGDLRKALETLGAEFEVDEGGGVFYGPKIDLHLRDALGRFWQGPTIQVDLNLPERFDVDYVGVDGAKHRAVMIHRTVLGSMERFVGGLIEHYAGLFPLWLSPIQVRILPVTDGQAEYAERIAETLRRADLRAEADLRSESLQAKIRDAELEKVPYMGVVGEREESTDTVALRRKGGGRLGQMAIGELIKRLRDEVEERRI